MSTPGHDLHALFPADGAALTALKQENAHFRALAEQEHVLQKEIDRIDAGLDPASDDRAEELKKLRLTALDEIAALIAQYKAA
ncbi:hypothetical protein U1769_00515 [Sphingomonas sp. ZT3P38]|uniref:YdcH family protein n=1 Tax=Parasphingomonas zepuensis TaxID=3096161 RepID=UPI002FC597AE